MQQTHHLAVNSIEEVIYSQSKKQKCVKGCGKYVEKSILAFINIILRSLSLFDLLTDISLLYLSSEAQFLPLTISLLLTILLPYILSYSVGIRIRFIHGIDGGSENGKNSAVIGNSLLGSANYNDYNSDTMGFRVLLNYLLIMPFGVLYYVFLDVLDLVFVYYKGYRIIVVNDDEQRLVLLEEILAQQCGLGNRMNYEGIKRQKSIAQLLFESIPQLIIQTLVVFEVGIFASGSTSVSRNNIYLSMGFAATNALVQGWRIKLEKNAVNETFVKYCVRCLTGRIAWIPFADEIEMLLSSPAIFLRDDLYKQHPLVQGIDYRIRYDYPCCLSRIFRKKGKITFDFSDVTIKDFINMLETTQVHVTHYTNLFNYDTKKARFGVGSRVRIDQNNRRENTYILKIDFGTSLRLLSFQNLSALFKVCKEKRIKIIGMKTGNIHNYGRSHNMEKDIDLLVKNSIEISAMNGNDTRISTLARDSFGVPYLFDMLDYQAVFENSKKIFYALIDYGFDVNIIDLNKNESIFYKLIQAFDVKTIKYIINLLVYNKRHQVYLNYYNNNGRSPLYFAIYDHKREKHQREKKLRQLDPESQDLNMNTNNQEWVYNVLTEDPQRLASVNFPVVETYNQVTSPIGLAIARSQYDIVKDLLKKGAILNCHDIAILPKKFERASERATAKSEKTLSILSQVVDKSQISLLNVCNENGNNPIHVLCQRIHKKWLKNTTLQQTQLNLAPAFLGLKTLFSMCPEWLFSVNHNKQLPIGLLLDEVEWKLESTSIFENDEIMGIVEQVLSRIMDLLNEDQG